MSYLIGMYVLLQGNNLPLFGFVPGSKKDKPSNQGLNYESQVELESVLPADVAEAIVENRKVTNEILNYEEILKDAILKAQAETAKEIRSTSIKYEHNIGPNEVIADGEGYETFIPMGFFEDLNGLSGSHTDGIYGSNSIWR